MRVDHVTIAGAELSRLENLLQTLGLGTRYGGRHSNGITHMSVLGFDDGSYIELISTIERGQKSPWWDRFIAGDAGVTAWAVEAEDVAKEAARLCALGIEVSDTIYMSRERPDGKVAEWDLAFVGQGDPGTQLPFIIKDRADRGLRIEPSESVTGTELTGIGKVVLGVADLHASSDLFRNVYDWPAPEMIDNALAGITLADFEATPVLLASPQDERSWLAGRLRRFGDAPCGVLIESAELEKTSERGLQVEGQISNLSGRDALWLASEIFDHTRIGFIERR